MVSAQHADDTSNEDIRHSLEGLRREMYANFITKGDLKDEIANLRVSIIRDVSGTLQSLVRDAMTSAMREERESEREKDRQAMIALYKEQRLLERQERKEDIQQVFSKVKIIVVYVLPFVTIMNVVGQWAGWW